VPPAALAAAQSGLRPVNEEAAARSRRGGDGGRTAEPEPTAAGDDELDDDEVGAEGGHCDITQESPIDLQHWGKWITAICVVGFDLELGQSLERIFPAVCLPVPPPPIVPHASLPFPRQVGGLTTSPHRGTAFTNVQR